jgi:hypothetical protein
MAPRQIAPYVGQHRSIQNIETSWKAMSVEQRDDPVERNVWKIWSRI